MHPTQTSPIDPLPWLLIGYAVGLLVGMWLTRHAPPGASGRRQRVMVVYVNAAKKEGAPDPSENGAPSPAAVMDEPPA